MASTVQSLNIKRFDIKVTHELFTIKLNATKLQQHLSLSIWRKNIISHPSEKKKMGSIQKGVRIANNWKKNNSWLLSFPKVTGILQKEKHVYPTVFSDADRMLRSVQYIIPAMEENSSRNSISPPNKIVNGLIQSDIHLQMTANDGNWKTHDPQSQNMTEAEECPPHS